MPKTGQRIPSGKLNIYGHKSSGFTYIGLLLLIAITGIGLSAAGLSWQYQVRSEKERQLLFVGAQFRRAINSYFEKSPSDIKSYPLTLDDLLLDKRFPNVQRHLRQIYPDPMTGNQDWGLVKQNNHIVGVYSRSKAKPIKQAGFSSDDSTFSNAASYQDWVFGQVVGTVSASPGLVSQ
jgi:type II secretory pathway pseudopilin PulG